MGYGDKSAKQKAAEKAADAASAADAAREEAEWGEGTKGVNKKKAAAEAARLAKEERRQAAGAQAAEEEAEMSASAKPKGGKAKGGGGGKPKLSRAEIAAKVMAEAEAKAKKEIAKSGGTDYMGALAENTNSLDDVDASGIDAAVAALEVSAAAPGGKRVNLKALYKAFEETELARLKIDQPGLKLSQYKERCFANWQKSPENPMNQ